MQGVREKEPNRCHVGLSRIRLWGFLIAIMVQDTPPNPILFIKAPTLEGFHDMQGGGFAKG